MPRGIKNPAGTGTVPEQSLQPPTVNPVTTTPEVKLEKKSADLILVHIDRDVTDGGIRVNGKLYVGNVTVSKEQAEDLLRIQEEYYETKKKMLDPTISVRMKNDLQKEVLFLADPKENESKKTWSRDYGLLGAREWSYCAPAFKERLLTQRKQMYGY